MMLEVITAAGDLAVDAEGIVWRRAPRHPHVWLRGYRADCPSVVFLRPYLAGARAPLAHADCDLLSATPRKPTTRKEGSDEPQAVSAG